MQTFFFQNSIFLLEIYKYVYINVYQIQMQIRKERTMSYSHLWPLARGHYKWRVQMTFLVSVGMKLKIQTRPDVIKKNNKTFQDKI